MTHDDVIRLAREAADPDAVDPLCGSDQRDLITLDLDEMVRFAALVAAEKDKQIAELQTAISVQAAAVRTYQSTERVQAHEMMELARKLRAESRPDALESERAANAQLTEELEKATELAKCGECGKSAAEGWALYCVRCCEGSMVAAAVAEEREACARVCDEVETQGHALWKRTYDPDAQGRSTGAADCAAAIRARGEK